MYVCMYIRTQMEGSKSAMSSARVLRATYSQSAY